MIPGRRSWLRETGEFLARLSRSYDAAMGRSVPLWLVLLLLLASAVLAEGYAWAVRYQLIGGPRLGRVGDAIVAAASYPSLLKNTILSLGHSRFDTVDRFPGQAGLRATQFRDTGYLLLAGFENGVESGVVKLIRLADGAEIHRWQPDFADIARRAPDNMKNVAGAAYHPLLMDDGSIVFSTNGPLVRLDRCSRIMWVLRGTFHHSVEVDAAGNLWVIENAGPRLYHGPFPAADDNAIAKVSPAGRLIEERSVSQILIDNGYVGLLYGVGPYENGPVHLNEIYPARSSTQYWSEGDVLLSLRNRSTVLIYRPSTGKIVWLKVGPWLNQHDAEFVGDSKISVVGNDVVRLGPEATGGQYVAPTMLFPWGHSTVHVFDFRSSKDDMPYDAMLSRLGLSVPMEGRARILPNGDVFVEETASGRLIRLSQQEVRWTYINRRKPSEPIRALSWSRYLTAEEVSGILPRLRCEMPQRSQYGAAPK